MRPLTSAEQEEGRSSLLRAGAALFPRLGLAKTTVRDICAEAGIPSGSFYLFFPSKDELYAELLTSSVERHRGENRKALESAPAVDRGGPRAETLLASYLSRIISGIESDPILAQFHRRDSMMAARRALMSARGGAAFAEISTGLDAAITEWKSSGLVSGKVKSIREIIQALIFLALNRSEIAGGAAPALIESYIDFVAAGLAKGSRGQGGEK